MNKILILMLILSFSISCSKKAGKSSRGNISGNGPSFTITTPGASTPFPQVTATKVSPGDIVSLLRDSDASCNGGLILAIGIAVTDSLPLTSEIWGVTSLTHQVRIKVLKPDMSVSCSSPVTMTYPVVTGMTKVVGAYGYYCGLLSNQTVQCWGSNLEGNLGLGNNDSYTTSGIVPGLNNVIDIDASFGHANYQLGHTCAVKSDGTVWCWGVGIDGQLGNGVVYDMTTKGTFSPVQATGINDAVKVATGQGHTCVIRNPGGRVSCWGEGSDGQLGNNAATDSNLPVDIAALDLSPDAIDITAGDKFSCAVLSDGTAWCWGDAANGRLGSGDKITQRNKPFQVVGGLTDAAAISAAQETACVLTETATLKCWGSQSYGIYGDNNVSAESHTPVAVPSLTQVEHFQMGSQHMCAALTSGKVMCWGNGQLGQLGNGELGQKEVPTEVLDISDAIAVGLSDHASCAILTGGRVRCWGQEEWGVTGAKNLSWDAVPRLGSHLINFKDWLMTMEKTCLIRQDDSVDCTGVNANASALSTLPLPAIKSFSNTYQHHCVLLLNGSIKCRGENTNMQLGDGTIIGDWDNFVDVLNITTATEMKAGGTHTCARLANNTLWCWGDNDDGQLGVGDFIDKGTPTQVTGYPGNIVSWDIGGANTCLVNDLGRVYCWGDGAGKKIGNGFDNDQHTPTLVSGITTAVEISVSGYKACARLADGSAQCWGTIYMGDGMTTDSNSPIVVTGVIGASKVLAMGEGGCVLYPSGRVDCWGNGWSGAVGNGSYDYEGIPVPTLITDAVELKGDGSHTACIKNTAGVIKCWGGVGTGAGGNTTYPISNYVLTP